MTRTLDEWDDHEHFHSVTIGDETYQVFVSYKRTAKNKAHLTYSLADLLMACFEIDEPDTLRFLIDFLIHDFLYYRANTPILLVGVKSGLRHDNYMKSKLFPLSFGPILAQIVGAIKYVECSTNDSRSVHDVFDEAVRATLVKIQPEILIDDSCSMALYPSFQEVFNNDTAFDRRWIELLFRDDWGHMHLHENTRQNALTLLDQQFTEIKLQGKRSSIINFFFNRYLELERLHLTYGPIGKNYIDSMSFEVVCSVWCIFEDTEKDPFGKTCEQVSNCKTLETLISDRCSGYRKNRLLSLYCFRADCSSIVKLFRRIGPLSMRNIVIVNCTGTLTFTFLSVLGSLEHLIIANTRVDIDTLSFPAPVCKSLLHLVMNECAINKETVPSEIGKLKELRVLNIAGNRFRTFSRALSKLKKLDTLLFNFPTIDFPPPDVLIQSVRDIINYLGTIQGESVVNKEAKLIVVGQEGVGKSTLIKGMKKNYWFGGNEPPPKTHGVEISSLRLKETLCRVYDMAGDVEYLKTHALFLSENCLHYVTFDLSQFVVSVGTRTVDQFGRLELWLQTIASLAPKTYVTIVATHADHPLIGTEILSIVRKSVFQIFQKYRLTHLACFKKEPFKECIICNPGNLPKIFSSIGFTKNNCHSSQGSIAISDSYIPHIIGYFEISSTVKYPQTLVPKNPSLDYLKSSTATSLDAILKNAGSYIIPVKWVSIRHLISQMLSNIVSLSCIKEIASENGIIAEETIEMLKFFHSQGTFLWYENIPEMQDVVIIDPQWFSDKLSTLISYRNSSFDVISDGILNLENLSSVWGDISKQNRSKLLALLRNAGLCFNISDREILFPCNLPIGWPDRESWPPLPGPSEKQASLLFTFSFLPSSFFTDLIVAINKTRGSFASNVRPLYYRFHILYITKDHNMYPTHKEQFMTTRKESDANADSANETVTHRIHYELMPYNNSLKVTIRGKFLCSVMSQIRTMVASVQQRRYPGITYKEHLLCPECELKRVRSPGKFELKKVSNPRTFDVHKAHDGFCSKRHKIGSTEDIVSGKLNSLTLIPLLAGQASRVVGETLEEQYCPKLFVVLPINLQGLSIIDRFVYSYIRDRYALHLLCECPHQWHFVDSPGFRIGKPKEFFEKHGSRVCKVLRVIAKMKTPFEAASSVASGLEYLLENYLEKYPSIKASLGSSENDIKDLKSSSGLQRRELARLLELVAQGRNFGPLVCTYVDKYDEWFWLCEEHSQRFNIIEQD